MRTSKFDKSLSLFIFLMTTFLFSAVSGYQHAGDIVEKILNFGGVFSSYFVLLALFAIYREVRLFSQKTIYIVAYSTLLLTLASYFYPLFKYWGQDANSFMSTFSYDLIINVFIFYLLIKEAKRERS